MQNSTHLTHGLRLHGILLLSALWRVQNQHVHERPFFLTRALLPMPFFLTAQDVWKL